LKKKILLFLRIFISGSILTYLVAIVEWERVLYILPKLRYQFVWQAFFLIFFSIFFMSIRWTLILKKFDIHQPILSSLTFYLIGGFYSIILPGTIGGDIVRLGLSAQKHGEAKMLIATSIVFERFCGLLALFMLSLASIYFFSLNFLGSDKNLSLIIVTLSVIFAVGLVCLVFVSKAMPETLFQKWNKTESVFMQRITLIANKLKGLPVSVFLTILLFSFCAHFIDIGGSFLLAKALNIDQPFTFFLQIMPLVYVITILPVSLGGLGVREGALVFFMVRIGVLESDAILLSFLIYLTRIAVGVVGGLTQFLYHSEIKADSR
jgi:uncharacterized protein (TIRG00374 family)